MNVLVEDQGSPQLSTTCFFFVTVSDVNNNDPQFDEQSQYEVTIIDSTSSGTEVRRTFFILQLLFTHRLHSCVASLVVKKAKFVKCNILFW